MLGWLKPVVISTLLLSVIIMNIILSPECQARNRAVFTPNTQYHPVPAYGGMASVTYGRYTNYNDVNRYRNRVNYGYSSVNYGNYLYNSYNNNYNHNYRRHNNTYRKHRRHSNHRQNPYFNRNCANPYFRRY